MKKARGQRPDGLIQVSITIDGKRRYFYGHTRKEAQEKAAAAKFKPPTEQSVVPPPLTVAEWVSQYLSTYRTKVNRAYLLNDNVPYNRLVEALGERQLGTITEADLQAALNAVSGMSFSTCRNYKQAIHRVFRKAVKNRLITDDPSAELAMPSCTKGTHRSLEPWEISVILRHWNAPGQWAGVWIMIMLLCGLRRGEMMGLQWKDVDLSTRILSVTQVAVIHGNQTVIEHRAKTEAGKRKIPICDALYTALSGLRETSKSEFVCVSARNAQLSETAVSRGIEKTLSVWSELTGRTLSFRLHDLRHTYATMLYESGVDVKSAQYLLGHSDLRLTLQIYTHLSESHRNGSEALLTDYLNNLSTK